VLGQAKYPAVELPTEKLLESSSNKTVPMQFHHLWVSLSKYHYIEKLGQVAQYLKLILIILCSIYAYPHTMYKLGTWLQLYRRKNYPLMSLRDIGLSVIQSPATPSPCPKNITLLENLPILVLLNIFSYLDVSDIAELMITNTTFNSIAQAKIVWYQLLIRDFPSRHHPKLSLRPGFRLVSKHLRESSTSSLNSRGSDPHWQYRVLVETAAVCRVCSCPPHLRPSCCYSSRIQRNSNAWRNQNKVTRAEFGNGLHQVFCSIAGLAHERLYHVPLTPFKLLGVTIFPICILIASARLRSIRLHGVLGHIARDFYHSGWEMFMTSPVDEGHWLAITGPACLLALVLRDLDCVVTKLLSPAYRSFVIRFLIVVGLFLWLIWIGRNLLAHELPYSHIFFCSIR
jgi:hypothetical protein